jgi:exopolysaccharide biosynthesis polyprenyl glycosylphosphotransferase
MSAIRQSAAFAEALDRGGLFTRPRVFLLSRRDWTFRRLLALADCLAIALSAALSLAFFEPPGDPWGQLAVGLATLPFWVVLFKLYGLYDRDAQRVSHATVDDIPWIFHSLVIGSLGSYALVRVLPVTPYSRREGVVFFIVAFAALLIARASVRKLVCVALPPKRLLLVGAGPMAQLLVNKLHQNPGYGLDPIGFLGDDGDGSNLPRLGPVDQLEEVCSAQGVEHVMFVAPAIEESTLEDLLHRTRHLNVRIGILPHVVDALGPSLEIDHVQGVTVLGISPPALTASSRFLKRTMDLTIASAALLAALPVMLGVAILVKLTSPGPILFSQERVGCRGRRFRIRKFRTMLQDAEAREQELKKLSRDPGWLLLDRDPRVTTVGRFLRQTSLDELPQLWNVLVGDMSLVGPRPMPPGIDEQISGWRRRRLDLTPGITGLWQVLGRTSIPFEEMLKLDYLYVTNWSLWQDVRLLIQTLPAVLVRRGVN